jgi:hypothetical protein
VELAVRLSPILYPSLWSPKGLPSPVLIVASVATALLGSAAVLSLGLGAFFSGARRLGAVLLILGVPAGSLFFGAHYALTGTDAISNQLAVTTTLLFGSELGVAEACLFTLLGAMLLGGARGRGLAKAERLQEEENHKKALRLYEVGLGKNATPRWWRRGSPVTSATPEETCAAREAWGAPSQIFGPATPIWRSRWRARRRSAT